MIRSGVVTKSHGSWYSVSDGNQEIHQCRIKGKFRLLKGQKTTNPVAVGDFVEFELEKDETGVITKIKDRENFLFREYPSQPNKVQYIACNLDQVICVNTLTKPALKIGFLDRLSVASEQFRIPLVVIFNKSDLWDEEKKENFLIYKHIYQKHGWKVISTSITEDLNHFDALLKGKTSLVSGHSGVGKSSLINAISPNVNLKTAELSEYSGKGQHTTTFAEMFTLKSGGRVIDSPGLKEFSPAGIRPENLSHFFPEMREVINDCKFNNCRHINEPGCKVLSLLESNEIPYWRYESYLTMYNDCKERNHWEIH